MTQTQILTDSPVFKCGARCAERVSHATAENVHDLVATLGTLSHFDYATYTRVSREWQRGYRTVNGNPDGRTADTARKAWGKLYTLAYGVSPRASKPRSTSYEATRRADNRATPELATPKTVSFTASDTLTLSDIERQFILALRARNLAEKDYAAILASL